MEKFFVACNISNISNNNTLLRVITHCMVVWVILCGGCSENSIGTAFVGSRQNPPQHAPVGVSAIALSSSSIKLSWSSVSDATEYRVYRSTSSYGTYTQVGYTGSTSYTNTGLSSGTTYYYEISAYNDNGEGPRSSYVSATTPLTFTDTRDGKVYKMVTINSKTWMAENLNYATTNGSWCHSGISSNCEKYGRLYDWSTAMAGSASSSYNPSGVQGICPAGWHLPSQAEWNNLITYAGGSATAGTKLKSTSGWVGENGTDNYGFWALPGGFRNNSEGSFGGNGYYGYWWSSTQSGTDGAYAKYMDYGNSHVLDGSYYKSDGFSVRCVRN